ncbi:hypothetical protein CAPTEDRAFT_199911 [Capitella teleta]|uniref:Mab-21-like nucleotidyltransferase domain-containing protein n=1 Tax=Capitella teleta TaxID=283909 RepID=R7UYI2_CAPTE|nr:hypothetical protein CAPTEDRAFT_199911 [Capitella teleta]|eukprot:ELU11379.1 hypothetical protein CAPTEDRAFT_199911 [Capitella teleta]
MASLDDHLHSYYDTCVAVDPSALERMSRIYRTLTAEIRDFLQQELEFSIGKLIGRGSSHEGLKIRKPDEFDVLIPIEIDDAYWCVEDFHEDNCFVTIASRYAWEQAGVLPAASIRTKFQGAVQRFVNKYIRGYKLKPSTHGPAVTLDVYDGNRKLFSVDLVPLVRLEGNWLVAKPHPASVGKPFSPERNLWRRSFTHQEHDYIKLIPLESKKILMIVKAMVIDNYAQMGMLPSYVYKVAFMHWFDRKEPVQTSISANVINFLSYLSDVLLRGTMKPFPDVNYHINILNNWNPTQLNNVAFFLRRIIARPETKLVAATKIPRQRAVKMSGIRQECALYEWKNSQSENERMLSCKGFLKLIFKVILGLFAVLMMLNVAAFVGKNEK